VFQSGQVAVATFGEAFIGNRSIAGHMDEFAVVEQGNCEHPGPVAERVAAFFGDRLDAQWAGGGEEEDDDTGPPHPDEAALGFLVSGYDDAGVGEAWEVALPGRRVTRLATGAEGGGAAWRGQADVVTRLVRGVDVELLWRLAAVNDMHDRVDAVMPLLDECGYRIPFDSMNLQDGIDFAVLCIRTTVDVQRLTLGPFGISPEFSWPGVGGPIEIATVTAYEGFRWVQRTSVQGERPAGLAEGQG
jgi:hypothetical protein